MNLAEEMRPKTWEEVIGNAHIVQALSNQINTGTLSQSIMISGPYGLGKTTFAKLIGHYLEADVIEENCSSDTGIDNVRRLIDMSNVSSLFAANRVFILDEVHGLSKNAQNALLKTLEEPNENTYFILLTTDPGKLLKTIVSRCVTYEVKPASNADIGVAVRRVLEKYSLKLEDPQDSWAIVEYSEGSLRSVYSAMEKLVAVAENGVISKKNFADFFSRSRVEVDENLPKAILDKNTAEALKIILENKKESPHAIGTGLGVYNYLRKVYLNNPQAVSRELMADLSFMLAEKRLEWEHMEHLVWKHG